MDEPLDDVVNVDVDGRDEQTMPWGQFNPYFQYLVHHFGEKQLAALKVKPPTPTAKAPKRKSGDKNEVCFAKKRVTQADVDRLVESPYFRKAVLFGCPPTLKVSCRKTFRKRLAGYREEMHRNVSKAMAGVEFVATTADGWSKHGRGFLGVTSHWIDPVKMERKSAALALRRLFGRHTHDRLAKGLCKVTESYGLPTSKITRCSTDSASNFRKAFKRFSEPQNKEGKESGRPDLVAQTLKAGFDVKLQVPGETRWNSEFDDRKQVRVTILKLIYTKGEDAFNQVLDKAGLSKLLPSEIRYIREYVYVMHPVAFALDVIQRDINMFAGYLIPTVLSMEAQLKKRRTLEGKPLKYCDVLVRTLLAAIRTPRRFAEYFEDTELSLAAVLLPQFKLDWVKEEEKRTDLKAPLIEEASKVVLPHEKMDAADATALVAYLLKWS
ncbi:hypothetical protein FOCC_FOCC012815 [Frankliniella occidentalis]|nr:hypothetical protein FOCC_FOCC012815 [Frankliniella occidentalis]